jgi:hypothetical protein
MAKPKTETQTKIKTKSKARQGKARRQKHLLLVLPNTFDRLQIDGVFAFERFERWGHRTVFKLLKVEVLEELVLFNVSPSEPGATCQTGEGLGIPNPNPNPSPNPNTN